MNSKKTVLFLCTGNSARSQMAEGLLRELAGERFEVFSAGTHPKGLHPQTIVAMEDIGIDVSRQRSKDVSEFLGRQFDYVITVCDNAKESCPIFPGHGNRIHMAFEDPAALEGSEQDRLALFRRVRDEIRAYLKAFPPEQ